MSEFLYLDTEFNGHGGELLSLAIADPGGVHWYGVLHHEPGKLVPWVREHVEPLFFKLPSTAGRTLVGYGSPLMQPLKRSVFRTSLRQYLHWRQGSTIVADWPADIAYLLQEFVGESFDQAFCPRMKFELIRTPEGEPKPEIPHNALSDAIALMEYCEAEV